jgi:hypothetical protein
MTLTLWSLLTFSAEINHARYVLLMVHAISKKIWFGQEQSKAGDSKKRRWKVRERKEMKRSQEEGSEVFHFNVAEAHKCRRSKDIIQKRQGNGKVRKSNYVSSLYTPELIKFRRRQSPGHTTSTQRYFVLNLLIVISVIFGGRQCFDN